MNQKPYSNPRWWDVPKSEVLVCCKCVHYLGRANCVAFPERIPKELLTVEISHDKPYPGDGGYLFTPMDVGYVLKCADTAVA